MNLRNQQSESKMNSSGKLCQVPMSFNVRWCGPTSLSAITGKSYEECVALIEAQTGKPFKKQSYLNDLKAILESLGYRTRTLDLWREKRKTTFAQMMAKRSEQERQQFILARVTDHFVAIKGDEVCDSAYTHGQPTMFKELPVGNKWKRVSHVIFIDG